MVITPVGNNLCPQGSEYAEAIDMMELRYRVSVSEIINGIQYYIAGSNVLGFSKLKF